MELPLVWIAGEMDHPSLMPAAAWLEGVAAIAVAPQDGEQLVEASFPAAIVLFQARPGRMSQRQVEQLHRRAPLARMLTVVGPWCEGEPRSGHPWVGVTRIYWHQWPARLPQALGLTASVPYEPRTSSDVDRLLRAVTPKLRRRPVAGVVALCTASPESFRALADACQAIGYRPQQEQVGANLLLIDGWNNVPAELSQRGGHVAPAVLLADWPRPEDLARAARLGISRVLARPLLLTDLATTLGSVLSQATPAAHAVA